MYYTKNLKGDKVTKEGIKKRILELESSIRRRENVISAEKALLAAEKEQLVHYQDRYNVYPEKKVSQRAEELNRYAEKFHEKLVEKKAARISRELLLAAQKRLQK